MSVKLRIAALLVASATLLPCAQAADENDVRAQFEGIVQGLNENSFDRFHRATDKSDLSARIFAGRIIEPEVKKAFSADFNTSIEQMFTSSFPRSTTDIIAEVIDFRMEGDAGRAVVRFVGSGYRYSYHVYDLRVDSRGRPVIVDWIDYYQGGRFSDEAGAALVMAMPGKQATRAMLQNKNVGEGEIFQMGELFKAVRDNQPERFFQIYDALADELKAEPVTVRLNLGFSLLSKDASRMDSSARMLLETYPDDALHSLKLLEFYIPTRQYQDAIDALNRLQQALGVREGAIDSVKASAALALGDLENAEQFALAATEAEPSLEVAWWSLLRVRTRAEDYEGATEALTRLEDEFGHILDARKLRKDRFLKVLAEQQAFVDWRATRN